MEVFHCTSEIEKTAPLKARDYKDPQIIVFEYDDDEHKTDTDKE